MATLYREGDADLALIQDKTIGIIGYGSQGHAHSLNLKDNGLNVMVGLYKGSGSWPKAEEAGLTVAETAEVARQADIIMMLLPDMAMRDVYRTEIHPHMGPGKTVMFAHGFNIHYKQVEPPPEVDVSMIAPKAPGHRMRELFTRGLGVPGLLAVEQGRLRAGSGNRPRLRQGCRLRQGGHPGDHLQGGDGDRPLR